MEGEIGRNYGALAFAPGETQATLPVTLLDDTRPEPDETLHIVLRNPVQAVVIGVNPATLRILNDDPWTTWLPIVLRNP